MKNVSDKTNWFHEALEKVNNGEEWQSAEIQKETDGSRDTRTTKETD